MQIFPLLGAWISITADDSTTLDVVAINGILCMNLIAVIAWYADVTYSDVGLLVPVAYLLLWLCKFFVVQPQPGPVKVGYEGIYCSNYSNSDYIEMQWSNKQLHNRVQWCVPTTFTPSLRGVPTTVQQNSHHRF